MSQRRLILHIGTHKTGSTSFQNSLISNVDKLADQDVHVVREFRYREGKKGKARTANAAICAHLFVRPELQTGARQRRTVPDMNPRAKARRRKKLAYRLRDNAAKTVLISAEAFCFLRTKEEWQNIREFAEMTNRRLEAIIVFRNNSDWRVSWENQLRYGLNLLDTSHDLPSELRLDGSWYFDKEAIRSFWSPIKLSELIYEDHPNIVEAIYQSFGVQTDILKTDQRLNLRKSSPTATA